jgi:monovalent cation/hydrogen antiporter
VPGRMSSILEGESLLNDASSLIIFRFALIAVATGQFFWGDAALTFSWMVVGGGVIGIAIAWLFMKMHKFLPTDANMDIVLTLVLVTPYIMYLAAEEAHSSGVLSVVCGGLFQSYRRNYFLTSSSRLRGENVWQSLVFVLNGLVFLLIGLDLPQISEGLKQEGISMSLAIGYGLLITAVLVVVRFISSFGALIVTKIASNFIEVADRNPGYRAPLLMSWTGMRGVVSLAAALSIPVQLSDGTPFPHRNLILFITFVVIISTLLLQGLTLPYLIKKISLPDYKDYLPDDEAVKIIKKGLAQRSLEHIDSNFRDHLENDLHLQQLSTKWKQVGNVEPDMRAESKRRHLEILEQQRKWLLDHNRTEHKIDEEIIRKFLRQIDLEEEKVKSA